ncbi:MAG: M48 family metalloprotease [Planctomycetota bacterium]|nr:M48 family metalloprotease [Planctomycetota bacterium]
MNPLPYHAAVRDYLQREEPLIWDWYSSHRVRSDQAETIRFDLLKSTYRIDRETQPDVYALADDAASRLSLQIPVTIYQAQNPVGLNASLAYVPDEAHIVLHGGIAAKLNEAEPRALLAHELGHMLL